MLVVREAVVHDMKVVNELVELSHRKLRRVYRPTRAALAHKAQLEPKLVRLVAVLEGVVVGTLQYYLVDDRFHFVGLAVHPDRQRRGVARALVESLAERAEGLPVTKLSLYTVKETGNVPVFERLGFRVISEEPDHFAESEAHGQVTDVYMERPVSR
jgi:ribosomal protein S18 acetylase RimI-like enzyme